MAQSDILSKVAVVLDYNQRLVYEIMPNKILETSGWAHAATNSGLYTTVIS